MNQTPANEEKILAALGKVPIFSHLDDKARRKLARLCTLKSFETGDLLYEEGAMALSLFIVVSGKVEAYKGSEDKKVGLETVAGGGVVGQLALLDDQPREASAVALEPAVCLQMTRDGFDTLVKRDPEIAWCLTPALAQRMRELLAAAAEARQAPRPTKEAAPAGEAKDGERGAAADGEAADGEPRDGEEDEDDDDSSELAEAMFKMMRMQYGMMAGTAKGMTAMAKSMETFLDSMAEETDFKTKEDWSDFFGKLPEAMVSATRDAMDECEQMPQDMLDAYHEYSETKS